MSENNQSEERTSFLGEQFDLSICDLQDHPYSSPSEDSEQDDELVDMNFYLFTMEKSSDLNLSTETENQMDQFPNVVASDSMDVDQIPADDGQMITQSLDWCASGKCSLCLQEEAVCCHDRPEILDFMNSDKGCITDEPFFQAQLSCEEGLQYNRLIYSSIIRDDSERQKYLEKVFDNGMIRHLCYRSFLVLVNRGQPLGRNVRVVLPQCVLSRIRQHYPSPNGQYTGFKPPYEHA